MQQCKWQHSSAWTCSAGEEAEQLLCHLSCEHWVPCVPPFTPGAVLALLCSGWGSSNEGAQGLNKWPRVGRDLLEMKDLLGCE